MRTQTARTRSILTFNVVLSSVPKPSRAYFYTQIRNKSFPRVNYGDMEGHQQKTKAYEK